MVTFFCLIFTTWIQTCCKVFQCNFQDTTVEFADGSEGTVSRWVFAPAPTGTCFTETHWKAVSPAVGTIFCLMAIPAIIWHYLSKQHRKNMLSTLESKSRFGWIYLRYKIELW
jgi:hypothetical protein